MRPYGVFVSAFRLPVTSVEYEHLVHGTVAVPVVICVVDVLVSHLDCLNNHLARVQVVTGIVVVAIVGVWL